jgi:hypothetical protein
MIPLALNPGLQERSGQLNQFVHVGNPLRVSDDRYAPPCTQVGIQLIGLERHDEVPGGGGQLHPAGNPDYQTRLSRERGFAVWF